MGQSGRINWTEILRVEKQDKIQDYQRQPRNGAQL
jgi:hypothetical protein